MQCRKGDLGSQYRCLQVPESMHVKRGEVAAERKEYDQWVGDAWTEMSLQQKEGCLTVRLSHHGTGSLEEFRETVLSAFLILFNSYDSPSYKGRKHRGRE